MKKILYFLILPFLAVIAHSQTISTLATNFNMPWGIAADNKGYIYVADAGSHQVFKINSITGSYIAVAGVKDSAKFGGDGGLAVTAYLNNPKGIAVDNAGNLYIADAGNNRIRKVDAVNGNITTVAGTGNANFSGDGGLAISAELNSPFGIKTDIYGNLYIGDGGNHRVRKITIADGKIVTIAGNGTGVYGGDNGLAVNASLINPSGIAIDKSGNMYIADFDDYRIRKINASTNIITTVAGTGNWGYSGDNGPASTAGIKSPGGITTDTTGNLYIADGDNNRVRKVNLTTGIITTIAGNGAASNSGDGGSPLSASIEQPESIVLTGGNMFITSMAFNSAPAVRAISNVYSTLPVKFLQFTAKENNNTVLVSWQTADEVNNNYFWVQHSTNGRDWVNIGKVLSSDGDNAHHYSFMHTQPDSMNYYRLQQVDYNGSYTYSTIRVVSFTQSETGFKVYPNPITGNTIVIELNQPVKTPLTYSIITGTGILVQTGTITTEHQLIELKSSAKGLYFLKIEGGQPIKLIKL